MLLSDIFAECFFSSAAVAAVIYLVAFFAALVLRFLHRAV